ncbi:DUF4166 domain-containing protein [Novosphingobium sp. ST904]|uniref:DUF4166 domain-containing protein n=1 Tax=Novosphingobium sp. ST904 TaxID=1684385 RepID=UPI0006C8A32D|nr:DUF4166 domain-containing protein [Novosphingobium sp. ST904]KPH65937.1 hypothetical protein ADT71_09240 [Novosphingobium sp. ST904]TCM38778.1 uncharacterized protein DUF4166 [Novosphingobium sp. ST904]
MSPPLFRQLLGKEMDALPPLLQEAHDASDRQRWEGLADITVSRNPAAWLLCRVMNLPARGRGVPVTVIFERSEGHENWLRTFAGRSYRSELSVKGGRVVERMGPATNVFRLSVKDGRLLLDLEEFRFLGLGLPSWLRPRCHASEREERGRNIFDVPVSVPWLGRVIRYTGSMERRDA